MRCLLITLGLAAAVTLAASPAVRRMIFAHPADQPPTPADWAPKHRYYERGQLIHTSDPTLYSQKEEW